MFTSYLIHLVLTKSSYQFLAKKKKKKINEESVSDAYDIDTTGMPDLENEESAAK